MDTSVALIASFKSAVFSFHIGTRISLFFKKIRHDDFYSVSENSFSANVYVSTIRSHYFLMEWLAHFLPGTFLSVCHK